MSTPFEAARGQMMAAFTAAGLSKSASTVLPGCTVATDFAVLFRRPDLTLGSNAQSRDYEIEYQYADASTLTEGAEIIVDGVLYRVRAEPHIDPQRGDDGFWRCAYLTEVR